MNATKQLAKLLVPSTQHKNRMPTLTRTDKIVVNSTPIHWIKSYGGHYFEFIASPIGDPGNNSSDKVRTIVTPFVAIECQGELLYELE